jgi:phosphoribosyl-ATP pyrophosphohydrolase
MEQVDQALAGIRRTSGFLEMKDALGALWARVKSRIGASPESSYTAQLLSAGPPRIAKKLGEEAIELALAGALLDREGAIRESADLIYHWLVLLAALDLEPGAVFAELERRQGLSGLEEKRARDLPD